MTAPRLDIASVDARAQQSGRTFREQWLVDMEAAIMHEHDIRDRRETAAEVRRIAKQEDARIRSIELALAQARARLEQHQNAVASLRAREEEVKRKQEELRRKQEALRAESLRKAEAHRQAVAIYDQRRAALERKSENIKRRLRGLTPLPELPMPDKPTGV